MKMIPQEIKRQKFNRVFRGFDPSEVEAYLETVAAEVEGAYKQVNELTQRITEAEIQLKDYKSVEKALQETFMQAQETTGKSIENARKEAQLIIQESELKASQIVDKARNDLTKLKEQFTILKAKKDSIVTRLKMLLNSELELIKMLEIDEELQSERNDDGKEGILKEKMEIEEIIKSLGHNS